MNSPDIETEIIVRVISALQDAGYHSFIAAYGEENIKSNDPDVLLETIQSTDESVLMATDPNDSFTSFVLFVNGNGHDVISDYGESLSDIIEPIIDEINEDL